ncbi:MAG: GntR family transcriptional regulator [Bacillota bacterium]
MLEKSIKLDMQKNIPLYQQLEDEIKSLIQKEQLQAGDKIPAERKISRELGVSRMTVHRALDNLAKAGWLNKAQGSGTYVSRGYDAQTISPLVSLSAQLDETKHQLTTEIKEVKVREADQKIADKLNLLVGEKVNSFIRRRWVGDKPLLQEKIFIPWGPAPDLLDVLTAENSLYQILQQKYNLALGRAEATVKAVIIQDELAQSLDMEPGKLGLYFDQITYLLDGQPIEWNQAYYFQENHIFKFSFGKNLSGDIQLERKDS